jgi:hypothetical protein
MASSGTALDDGFSVEGLKTGNVVGGVEKTLEGRGIPMLVHILQPELLCLDGLQRDSA